MILARGASLDNKQSFSRTIHDIETTTSSVLANTISRIGLDGPLPYVGVYDALDDYLQQSMIGGDEPTSSSNKTFTPVSITLSRKGQ